MQEILRFAQNDIDPFGPAKHAMSHFSTLSAMKTERILDSADAGLQTHPTLTHKRNRSVLPAVRVLRAIATQ